MLKRLLDSLSHQTMEPKMFEIIVVDDCSTDQTKKICHMMSKKLPNMKYFSTRKNIGLGSAGNFGIQSARGKYLLFIDDDCIAQSDWIEEMCSALDTEPVIAGAVVSPVSNYITLCHNISQLYPFMPGRKARIVDFVAGLNMGFKRPVLEKLSGFQEGLRIPPDTELILRAREAGYHVYFKPDALVTHAPERTNLRAVFRYSSEHAAKTILLRNKYRTLLSTPFVLRSPILILLAAPLIAMRVTLGIYLGNFRLTKLFWTAPLVFALKLAWCWGAFCGLRMQRKQI